MNARRNTLYWASTILVAIAFVGAGAANLLRIEGAVRDVTGMGYPVYFMGLLGLGKLLGGLAILAPRLPRIKEWAYSGIAITTICAAYSHHASGAPAPRIAAPLVLFALALASWALRPGDRVLGAIAGSGTSRTSARESHEPLPAAAAAR